MQHNCIGKQENHSTSILHSDRLKPGIWSGSSDMNDKTPADISGSSSPLQTISFPLNRFWLCLPGF